MDEVSRLKSTEFSKQIAAICERFHVKKIALFGSAARGELKANSDIDLLAEFKAGETTAIISHEYGQIDYEMLYRTVVDDIPVMIAQLKLILPQEGDEA